MGLSSMQSKAQKVTGYNHTYMDDSGIDIEKLKIYPSDNELAELVSLAYSEALELSLLLSCNVEIPSGIPFELLDKPDEPETIVLPGIDSFDDPTDQEQAPDSEILYEIIEHANAVGLPLDEISEPCDNLVYAAAAIEVEQGLMIKKALKWIAELLSKSLGLADSSWPSEPEPMVDNMETAPPSKGPTHLELAQVFVQTLCDEETAKLLDCLKQWTASKDISKLKGNTANAKEAGDQWAMEYVQSHRNCLCAANLMESGLLEDLLMARISFAHPLEVNHIIWTVIDSKLCLSK
ncbi:hypothetical protein FRC11_001094, partial [Ceratobasidium sp. 423]